MNCIPGGAKHQLKATIKVKNIHSEVLKQNAENKDKALSFKPWREKRGEKNCLRKDLVFVSSVVSLSFSLKSLGKNK